MSAVQGGLVPVLSGGNAVTFDYGDLAAADVEFAEQVANRIHDRMGTTIFDVGRDLLAAKARLPHGSFGAWVEARVGLKPTTALNYMNSARLHAKSSIVEVLPPAALYALAASSVPEAAQDIVIARLKAGGCMKEPDVRDIVKTTREACRKERLKPADRAREERRERRAVLRANKEKAAWQAEALKRETEANAVVDHLIEFLGGVGLRKLDLLMQSASWSAVGAAWHERKRRAQDERAAGLQALPRHRLNGENIRDIRMSLNNMLIARRSLEIRLSEFLSGRGWEDFEFVPGVRHALPSLARCLEAGALPRAGSGLNIDVNQLRLVLGQTETGRKVLAEFEGELARSDRAAEAVQ